jgi:RNA-directed DNA polymerase
MIIKINTLIELAEYFQIQPKFLALILKQTDNFYRENKIPKRSGGLRDLFIPIEPLKIIQRKIKDQLLDCNTPLTSTHAYCYSRSIITNASTHIGNPFMFKLDIKDFFPHIKSERVYEIFDSFRLNNKSFEKHNCKIEINSKICRYLTRLCMYKGGLPQGAPTSPSLANLAARSMDLMLYEYTNNLNIKYTRYSDDMVFSSKSPMQESVKDRIMDLVELSGFNINTKKIAYINHDRTKIVTGILVTDSGLRLPKKGRRELRSAYHNFINQKNTTTSLKNMDSIKSTLIGKFNHWLSIEPRSTFPKTALENIIKMEAPLLSDSMYLNSLKIKSDKLIADNNILLNNDITIEPIKFNEIKEIEKPRVRQLMREASLLIPPNNKKILNKNQLIKLTKKDNQIEAYFIAAYLEIPHEPPVFTDPTLSGKLIAWLKYSK